MSPRTMATELRLYGEGELGADGYPVRWHRHANGIPALKDLVRMAADYRCVRCGHPYRNGEHGRGEWSPCDELCLHSGALRIGDDEEAIGDTPVGILLSEGRIRRVEAKWRILTVHHLDGNKQNCRWWNLAALCQRCHLTIQGRVRMERVWPWEHSDWFKPYVAGFYAFSYLGEDLARHKVEERLEELLDLERAA